MQREGEGVLLDETEVQRAMCASNGRRVYVALTTCEQMSFCIPAPPVVGN